MLDIYKEYRKFDRKTYRVIMNNLDLKPEVRMMKDIKGYFFEVKFTPIQGDKFDEIKIVFSKINIITKDKKRRFENRKQEN